MNQTNAPKTSGFGPVALIVTGVVCFAAGYMVNDVTKALGIGAPEVKHTPGSGVSATPRDPDPMPSDRDTGATEQPAVSAPDSPAPENKDEAKEEKLAPAGGAGAPPPKG
jgi:hypothetical protein